MKLKEFDEEYRELLKKGRANINKKEEAKRSLVVIVSTALFFAGTYIAANHLTIKEGKHKIEYKIKIFPRINPYLDSAPKKIKNVYPDMMVSNIAEITKGNYI